MIINDNYQGRIDFKIRQSLWLITKDGLILKSDNYKADYQGRKDFTESGGLFVKKCEFETILTQIKTKEVL